MIRLRLSMSNEQWTAYEDAAKVLGLDPKVVLQISAAIGLRFLDMSVIHPINAAISKAIEESADQGPGAMATGITKIMGQGIGINPPAEPGATTSQPKKTIPHKKGSRKGK